MIDRRRMLQAMALAPAAAAIPLAGFAVARASEPLLYDRRFAAARRLAALARRQGVRPIGFAGDITSLWRGTLRAHWRGIAAPLSGITTERALLCLEQLARDQDQLLLARATIPGAAGLVRWRMAPRGWKDRR